MPFGQWITSGSQTPPWYTDREVGRIIDYLEQSGQLDNTIVL
jgi:membrane-anchored protein YejM (alkaline phosphatase superfamily)